MTGLLYSWDDGDIVLRENGTFRTADIDSQTCALIGLSQICRITVPELGAQLGAKLQNRKLNRVRRDVSAAIRMVENDGGRDVVIELIRNAEGIDPSLNFDAVYG